MLQINVVSLVRITNRLVAHFETTNNEGGILIISSMAAIFPVPYQSAYSATKAFVLSFGTALAHEIKNPLFSLTVYAPGGIVTEMTAGENFHDLKGWLMPVKEAAKEGIYAFHNRKTIYIPGFFNRAGSVFMNLLPKKFVMGKMSKVYYRALLKAEKGNNSEL
jgi:short-subunit dehydrogenase